MSRRPAAVLTLLALLGGPAPPVVAQRPLNLDFERPAAAQPTWPWGWTLGWSAFAGGSKATFVLDTAVRHEGSRSLRVAIADSVRVTEPQQLMLQLPAAFVRGREVTLTGWIRTAGLRGKATLSLEAWGDRVVPAADSAIAAADAVPWRRHALVIRVPEDASIHSLVLIIALEGQGTAWFDGWQLAVDGLATSALPALAPDPAPADLAALRRHAMPLRIVEPPSTVPDDGDLAAIDRIIGNARVVALGESTHGTSEFFSVKHRLLEYLVRVHGFRVFAIEANQLAVERINRYVQGGEGTAREVTRAMFAVWNTEEMLALVEWLRTRNLAHPADPVRFAGYDMQDHQQPIELLRSFLATAGPELLPVLDTLTAEYRSQRSYASYEVADTLRARWGAQADSLWRLVQARRGGWLATAGKPEDTLRVEWAVQAANLYRQAARLNVSLNSPDRDSLMAANLDWLLGTITPGARAVVWAHDVHVSHGGDPARSFNGGAQMGAYLRRVHGDDYRAVSLLTFEGHYTATRSLSDYTMVPVVAFPGPTGSVEAALHQLGKAAGQVGWVVDLRTARTDAAMRWLDRPRPIRHIGYAAYDYGFDLTAVMPLEFDGIVFVDRTTASRLLR